MNLLRNISNNYMINTLWLLFAMNYSLFAYSGKVSHIFWWFVLSGEIYVFFYQIWYTEKMDYLIHYGKKILFSSGISYKKYIIPNRVNVSASPTVYCITIQDHSTGKKYKTNISIGYKKHCQEFEDLLKNNPIVEVLVDDYDNPNYYLIQLDELVKYTTAIELKGGFKKKSKLEFFFVVILNVYFIILAWKFHFV